MNKFITRKEYMANHFTHNQYYGQFVDDSVISVVCAVIGKQRVTNSMDEHFNDIPLHEWDKLANSLPQHTQRMVAKANGSGGTSLSDRVCVLKAAAKHIRRLYSEPKRHSITVRYREVGVSSGSSSFDTDINGTVDGILDYYKHAPINIGSGDQDRIVKVIGIDFHS